MNNFNPDEIEEETEPLPITTIDASELQKMVDAVNGLVKTGLNKNTIVAILNDRTRLGKMKIRRMLNALETLYKEIVVA